MNAIVPITVAADDLEVIQRTARLLAVSGYFDAKGDTPMAVAQVATKILAGRELGFGPFAAVNGIYIISGRPSVGANLMASAVKGSGRYDYRVREMSDKTCRIEFLERTGGKLESLGVSEFTAEDAKRAGTKNLDKFARNMLFARAMSNGVRWYCPDVFSGNAVYVPEELGADVDGDGNVVEGSVRVVDASTGEISQPATSQPAPPRSAPPAQPDTDRGMEPKPDSDGQQLGRLPNWDYHQVRDEPPTDEEHSIISEWRGVLDAQNWAVQAGYCDNEHNARAAWVNVVKACGGFSPAKPDTVYLAFLRERMAKQPAANGVA